MASGWTFHPLSLSHTHNQTLANSRFSTISYLWWVLGHLIAKPFVSILTEQFHAGLLLVSSDSPDRQNCQSLESNTSCLWWFLKCVDLRMITNGSINKQANFSTGTTTERCFKSTLKPFQSNLFLSICLSNLLQQLLLYGYQMRNWPKEIQHHQTHYANRHHHSNHNPNKKNKHRSWWIPFYFTSSAWLLPTLILVSNNPLSFSFKWSVTSTVSVTSRFVSR